MLGEQWAVQWDVLAVLQKPWAPLLLQRSAQGCGSSCWRAAWVEQLQGDGKDVDEQQVQQLVVEFVQTCRAELSGFRVAAHAVGSNTPAVW